jgi:hypothetical protein
MSAGAAGGEPADQLLSSIAHRHHLAEEATCAAARAPPPVRRRPHDQAPACQRHGSLDLIARFA